MVLSNLKATPAPPATKPAEPDWPKQAAENLAGWQRERANFENFKKEVERSRADIVKLSTLDFVEKLVPVLANFERALGHLPPDASASVKAWLSGMSQVQKQLVQVLQEEGLTEIAPTVGSLFDPHNHEAVANVEGGGVAVGHVVALLEKGYRLHERLIKPARVTVAK